MSDFISKLQINAFRGVKDLTLDDLSTVNVLVGANNCGKTSILESIFFLSCPTNSDRVASLAFTRHPVGKGIRNRKIADHVANLFLKEKTSSGNFQYLANLSVATTSDTFYYSGIGHIEVFSPDMDNSTRYFVGQQTYSSLKKPSQSSPFSFPYTPASDSPSSSAVRPNYTVKYLSSGIYYYNVISSLFSSVVMDYSKDELLNLIQSFDPSISDITVINEDVFLHSEQNGALPLYSYGTGLQKVVLLSLILLTSRNGILLIDEIDDAINISAFKLVFPWFLKKCEAFNIQAFITTHSAEAIDAILTAKREKGDDLRIITLRKTPKTHKTIAKVRTGSEALADRENFKMELRV